MKRHLFALLVLPLLTACSSMTPPSQEHLDAIGVKNGASVFDTQRSLGLEGYACNVTGAKHENFDCSKMGTGYAGLATCIARVDFHAGENNQVQNLSVPNVACAGF